LSKISVEEIIRWYPEEVGECPNVLVPRGVATPVDELVNVLAGQTGCVAELGEAVRAAVGWVQRRDEMPQRRSERPLAFGDLVRHRRPSLPILERL